VTRRLPNGDGDQGCRKEKYLPIHYVKMNHPK